MSSGASSAGSSEQIPSILVPSEVYRAWSVRWSCLSDATVGTRARCRPDREAELEVGAPLLRERPFQAEAGRGAVPETSTQTELIRSRPARLREGQVVGEAS